MKNLLFLVLILFLCSSLTAQEGRTFYSLKNAFENPSDVYILNLSKANLKEFPLKIIELPNLRVLDLSFNRLHTLPPEIGKLLHLESLDLSFNALENLPPEIGLLTNLRELNLSFNRLTHIPPQIGHLKMLKALNISFNKITHLPPGISEMEGLRFFSLKLNPVTGIPKELKALKQRNPKCRIIFDSIPEMPGFGTTIVINERIDSVTGEPGNKDEFYYSSEKKKDKPHKVPGNDKYSYGYAGETQKEKNIPKQSLDFSFFTTDELKQLYRDAFSRKDYEQISILQEELAKRTKENPQETDSAAAQYRSSGDPLKGLNVSASKETPVPGRYFVLIIGINNYKGIWLPLKNAVNDAKGVEKLLRENYRFDQVRTLYDEKATRQNIMKEFEYLVLNAGENDNVFIYYSGHGEYKQDLNRGYWVPVDATDPSTFNLIPNSDIQTFLGGIKSKHTLLATDACFSGDIFRGNTYSVPFEKSDKYYRKVYELVSRQALTAGSIEPVVDSGMEGHSVFTFYLLKSLKGNQLPFFDAGQLFEEIKIPVMNNSDQTPLLKPVKDTGDEGGQFIFIRK
ncbi:MAG: caspase family protein [Bacteroidetes bacterium]|nr:caspase family protein [Bacteroidota bacterium]